jgi:hypothetical protein
MSTGVLGDGVADALEHDAVTPLQVLPHEVGDTPRRLEPGIDAHRHPHQRHAQRHQPHEPTGEPHAGVFAGTPPLDDGGPARRHTSGARTPETEVPMPDPNVRDLLLARVDEITARMSELIAEVWEVTEQLAPSGPGRAGTHHHGGGDGRRNRAAGPRPPARRARTVRRIDPRRLADGPPGSLCIRNRGTQPGGPFALLSPGEGLTRSNVSAQSATPHRWRRLPHGRSATSRNAEGHWARWSHDVAANAGMPILNGVCTMADGAVVSRDGGG